MILVFVAPAAEVVEIVDFSFSAFRFHLFKRTTTKQYFVSVVVSKTEHDTLDFLLIDFNE